MPGNAALACACAHAAAGSRSPSAPALRGSVQPTPCAAAAAPAASLLGAAVHGHTRNLAPASAALPQPETASAASTVGGVPTVLSKLQKWVRAEWPRAKRFHPWVHSECTHGRIQNAQPGAGRAQQRQRPREERGRACLRAYPCAALLHRELSRGGLAAANRQATGRLQSPRCCLAPSHAARPLPRPAPSASPQGRLRERGRARRAHQAAAHEDAAVARDPVGLAAAAAAAPLAHDRRAA
jgi:hypothetical protein